MQLQVGLISLHFKSIGQNNNHNDANGYPKLGSSSVLDSVLNTSCGLNPYGSLMPLRRVSPTELCRRRN